VTLEAELEQRQNAAVKTGVLASAMAPRVREVKETFLRPNKLRAATSSRSARTARGVRSAQGEAPLTRPRLRGARQWQLRTLRRARERRGSRSTRSPHVLALLEQRDDNSLEAYLAARQRTWP
jgi:hypothetical protein